MARSVLTHFSISSTLTYLPLQNQGHQFHFDEVDDDDDEGTPSYMQQRVMSDFRAPAEGQASFDESFDANFDANFDSMPPVTGFADFGSHSSPPAATSKIDSNSSAQPFDATFDDFPGTDELDILEMMAAEIEKRQSWEADSSEP